MYHKYFGKQIAGHDPKYSLWRNVYNKHPVIIFYGACVVASIGVVTYKYFTKYQKPVDEITQYKDSYQVARYEDMLEPLKPYYGYKNDWTLKQEEQS